MLNCQYAGCGTSFEYNPSRPTRQYCDVSCRTKAKEDRRTPRGNDSRNGAKAEKRARHDVEFIAVDGEGFNTYEYVEVWDDEENNVVQKLQKVHNYALFSAGDESLHHDGERLRHDEVFEFLYALKLDHPNAAFVGFFLGYDFSQWLKSLPENKGNQLFHPYGIQKRMPRNKELKYPFPVVVDGRWDIDFLGMKRFKLRPYVRREMWPEKVVNHRDGTQSVMKTHPYKWMYVNDAGSFFQTSLLVAIDPKKWANGTAIVSDEEMAILVKGKGDRSDARFDSPEDRAQAIRYNTLENDVLARLMRTVNQGFVADGIRLRNDQWFGPGQAAQAWMRNIGAPTGDQIREAVPVWAMEAARMSYYGGWFETFVNGLIPGVSYSYDINSAYPYAIATLPCLLHGEWTRGEGKPGKLGKGNLRLVNARFVGKDNYIGTMPHRDINGGISRPAHTSGWHWQHEIDAARTAGMIANVYVDHWIDYNPCSCKPPYESIRDLYEGRLKVGKETPFGKSKKLVYNSAYGKMAQSIGNPKYSCAIYASLITAHCRTKILHAIATHPDKTKAVAMVATDGIVFLSPHPTLDVNPTELGKWDYTEHHNLSILMPGLYWDDASRESIRNGENLKLKSRGVSGKYLAPWIDTFDRQWAELHRVIAEDPIGGIAKPDQAPTVEILVEFGVISPRLAVARDRWDTCGKVVWDDKRKISANPEGKRSSFYVDGPLLRTGVRIRIRDNHGQVMKRSLPYDNFFGGDPLAELQKLLEPEELLTQDGTVSDIWHAVVP